MQPLLEDICQRIKSQNYNTRKKAIELLVIVLYMHHSPYSTEYRWRVHDWGSLVPKKYLSIFLFEDEWGKLATFLSRQYIENYTKSLDRIFHCLYQMGHPDALEPLLDIMVEAPGRLIPEDGNMGESSATLFWNAFCSLSSYTFRHEREIFRKAYKNKNPVTFFEKWMYSDHPMCREIALDAFTLFREKFRMKV